MGQASLSRGSIVVHPTQYGLQFALAGFMLLHRPGRHQQLIKRCRGAGRLVGEIAPHGGEWNEHFVDVPAVVAGILLLSRHYADDGVRKRIQIDAFTDGIAPGKKLLGGIAAHEGHASRFPLIIPVVETAVAHVEAANVTERRMRSGHGECGIVVTAVSANVVSLELRNGVFAIRRLCLHRGDIRIFPVHFASGARPADLHAGAAVKNDQDIFAQVTGLDFLSLAQPFARRNHQNDGDDAPCDSEHGQKRAQLVGP